MFDKDQLVSIPEAAKLVGMEKKVELFRYYIRKGYTPEAHEIGGKVFFDRRDLSPDWKPEFKRPPKRKYE